MNRRIERVLTIGVILLIILVVSACQAVEDPLDALGSEDIAVESVSETVFAEESAVGAADVPAGLTMADRIAFQDQLAEASSLAAAAPGRSPAAATISMAERIHFHDRLWAAVIAQETADQSHGMSMGDRIQFHDRLWEQDRSFTER